MIPVDCPPINTQEWRDWRRDHAREYVSASEAAAAANLSPFQSARDLLAEKMWPEDQPADENRDWRFMIAHYTQDVLIRIANELHSSGMFIENHTTYRHATHQWMWATPDGFTTHGPPEPVEVKFTTGWHSNHPPAHILAQLLIQAYICQAEQAWLIVARPHVQRLLDVQVVALHRNYLEEEIDAPNFLYNLHAFHQQLALRPRKADSSTIHRLRTIRDSIRKDPPT